MREPRQRLWEGREERGAGSPRFPHSQGSALGTLSPGLGSAALVSSGLTVVIAQMPRLVNSPHLRLSLLRAVSFLLGTQPDQREEGGGESLSNTAGRSRKKAWRAARA